MKPNTCFKVRVKTGSRNTHEYAILDPVQNTVFNFGIDERERDRVFDDEPDADSMHDNWFGDSARGYTEVKLE